VIKNWRLWVGAALSVLALYLTLRTVDLAQVQVAFAHANLSWIPPAIVAFLIGLYFRAHRWSMLMGDTPIPITWHAMLIGYMLNMTLPLRLGEVAKAWVISQRGGVTMTRALSSIVVDRILDLATVLGLFALFAFFVPMPAELARAAWSGAAVLLVLLILAGLALWQAPRVEGWLRALLSRQNTLHAERWIQRFHDLRDAFRIVGGRGRVLRMALDTVLMWGFAILLATFVQGAFMTPSVAQAGLVIVAGNLGGAAPSAPGGLGLVQGAAKLALVGPFGVDEAQAVAFIFAQSIGQQLALIALGFFSLARVGLSLRDAANAGRATPS